MDNRLVLTVLFVALSWMAMMTDATTTAAPATTSHNTSTHNMTSPMPPHNMTSPMPPHNMTSPMPPHNMTSPMAPHNMTSPMAPHNMSTPMPVNDTSTPMPTTAAPATEAPSVVANITVETLNTSITRTQCGTEELCASEPADCDPSQDSSCYFLSAETQNGNNFTFGLSGESEGYIAVSLSTDETVGNNDTTYVCANNNGKVKFFSTVLNNGQLTRAERNVGSVKGSVNGNKIQCTFVADAITAQTRAAGVTVAISTGPFNSSTDDLGSPNLQFKSNVIDLANPNATVTNTISNTTNSNTTTTTANPSNHGITFQQTLMQALLISFGILGLTLV
uniref:putative ferric-chelate reductase 1 isoform X2 n=1 Tax=Solea senegalensis TaxID=28829 RepID=UPI001CD8C6D5|nr:putative ferric-chelate reductase 1 isoform X2 [Solea senegalensis]